MVATSVCARGLDIKHIKVVINYVCPNHSEDYVHRVGRTGRAGNKGTSYTFILPEECQYAADLIRALENSGNPVPEDLRRLDEDYQQKVLDGELERKKGNIGFSGRGFEFTEEENNRMKEFRKELSKAYGLAQDADGEDGDEMDNEMVKSAQQKEEERKKQED
jgi:ATP-dependent RNA helicase DDX46/PRP5